VPITDPRCRPLGLESMDRLHRASPTRANRPTATRALRLRQKGRAPGAWVRTTTLAAQGTQLTRLGVGSADRARSDGMAAVAIFRRGGPCPRRSSGSTAVCLPCLGSGVLSPEDARSSRG
jgi:hypothetical protein